MTYSPDRRRQSDDSGEHAVRHLNLSGHQDAQFGSFPPSARPPRLSRRRLARLRAALVQTLIFGAIVAVFGALLGLVWEGLRRHGIGFSLDFLRQQAGFDISEGFTFAHGANGFTLSSFNAQMTNAQALVTGLYNTLVVAVISIVLSTVLGVLIGVTRMSKNWVAKNWAWGFIELVRNTPLLIQILFWYFAVVLQLPSLSQGSLLHGALIASRQGVFVPWLVATPGTTTFMVFAAAALLLAAAGCVPGARKLRRGAFAVSALLLVAGCFVGGRPFSLDYPQASLFSVSGGIGCSPEMASLIAALSVNTAAYIAEIVRGAVEAIDKGQWEAASALGLGGRESLWVIVLPQALRVMLPSLGNQYISLTKSTSFAIAIGFPDLFNVYGTVANQSGRSLEGILIVMAVYLAISVSISALMNLYNRRVVKKGAR
ncbi:amino acid ABC transporter permease [Trinickia dinghuensis]|uniref:ABC transporter permease subunit n=1 Tax=Trinickia dinghuensis TaxID=2291023 RepID=A0A3D8JXY2_9BURK|nr:ABC transporter permease subunit [Trinickia dinghuensis]RDU97211.1 ABC transporter permease subunit [Trinickia dinghuensis]